MRLRFWNRGKRERKLESIDRMVGTETVGFVDYLKPIPSIEQRRLDSIKQDRERFDRLEELTKEDQCKAKLKSGKRCSRNAIAEYCWQHTLDSGSG